MSALDAGAPRSHQFFVDSSATDHVTGEVGRLVNVRPLANHKVVVGNGDAFLATAVGDLSFEFDMGGRRVSRVAKDVLCVAGIKVDVLSLAKLIEPGTR
ncbi:hypothetical protein BC831DRAFT_452373 [Entophlyctis helioformis]|nr:hypothetical protein BC831DRAFT_452373 [Entophlyctis helioformis]